MELGKLFSKSAEDYKKNFKLILKLYFWFAFVPLLIGTIIFGSLLLSINFPIQDIIGKDIFSITFILMNTPEILSFLTPISISLLFVYLVLEMLGIFLQILLLISLIYISIYNKMGGMSFKETVKKSLKYFWGYVGLLILFILALFGLFILLVIPAIIFGVYWILSSYFLVGEDKVIIESMKKSKKIVKLNWWRVFGFYILIILISIIILYVFEIPLVVFNFLSEELNLSIFSKFMIEETLFYISIIGKIIMTPFMIIFGKNLYLELSKKRK